MNNVIVVLCTFMALAHAEDRLDDYIKINRAQLDRMLDDYGVKLHNLRKRNDGRIEAIAYQKDFFAASITQNERYLSSLAVVNSSAKKCVKKYEGDVPTFRKAEQVINKCKSDATNQFTTLFNNVAKVRDNLLIHIGEVFDGEIPTCFAYSNVNYTCVSDVIAKINSFSRENQNSFEHELEAADCQAKANAQKFTDCVYSVGSEVLIRIGHLEVFTKNCINAGKECPACEEHACGAPFKVSINSEDEVIANPLYGRTDQPKCVLLDLRWRNYLSVLDVARRN